MLAEKVSGFGKQRISWWNMSKSAADFQCLEYSFSSEGSHFVHIQCHLAVTSFYPFLVIACSNGIEFIIWTPAYITAKNVSDVGRCPFYKSTDICVKTTEPKWSKIHCL